MLAAALTTLPHAASTAAAAPHLGATTPDPHNAVGQGNATSSQPAPDDLTTQQVHDIQEATKLLPDNVSSFYTRGCDLPVNPAHLQPEASYPDRETGGGHGGGASTGYGGGANTGYGDSSSLVNSCDVFADSVKILKSQGGPTNPAALFAAQAQIIDATLKFSFVGQLASKATSGIQALFNNQV